MIESATLARRLERHRAWQRRLAGPSGRELVAHRRRADALAASIARTIEGDVVESGGGVFVRREGAPIEVPLDRDVLADMPGQPPAEAPLVFLDTETTGLGTAACTFAFLVGLATWRDGRLHPIQLLLPDQSEEDAMLAALAGFVPEDAWFVTYNGRGFDWPLLVTRHRMNRRSPPRHAGHLDLLPFVRRLFRHRLSDARLGTVEAELLGLQRGPDVGGWEIPGRYLAFLRDGSPHHLVDVIRHNAFDVASLAVLLRHLADRLADRSRWPDADPGDLAGLARVYHRDGRHEDSLACIDAALAGTGRRRPAARPVASDDDPWWSPRRRPDFGGSGTRPSRWPQGAAFASGWPEERLLVERARILRRLGRIAEAIDAWTAIAATGGTAGALACVEIAKVREHLQGDLPGAMEATLRAREMVARDRSLGRPDPRLEKDLAHRIGRLRRRVVAKRAA